MGWVLLAEIKMVIWLMNVDDRFCPILGGGWRSIKSHGFRCQGYAGFWRMNFMGVSRNRDQVATKKQGEKLEIKLLEAAENMRTLTFWAVQLLGQSSCIPLRTFGHRGFLQDVANPWVQPPVLHDCQQKLPMFGKSLGMCLYFVCCLGFKRHDNEPQMDT